MAWLDSAENLQTLTLWIQLIGVPIGIAVFVYGKFREIRDRESATFALLGDKYEDYLMVCLSNPDLPTFDAGQELCTNLDPEQQKRLQIIYCLLVNLHERAYLMYRDTRSRTRRNQWEGWQAYLDQWLGNANFAAEWETIKSQFDREFVQFADQRRAHVSHQKRIPVSSPAR